MLKNKSLFFVLAASALVLVACGENKTTSSSVPSTTNSASSQGGISSQDGTSSSSTTPIASSSSSSSAPIAEKVDVAYADDTFVLGGAGDAKTGRFVYWAGDGGTVSSATKINGKYHLSYISTGNWYGVQVFYNLPYAEAKDTYEGSVVVTSDVAGQITLNDKVYDVVAGNTTVNFAAAGTATFSLQLGVKTTGSKLAGTSFDFAMPIIHDTTVGAKYDEVKFVNGETTVKDIQVKNGKTVVAPIDPTPATGYVFDDWYNGTTQFSASTPIIVATTYTAKFIKEADAVYHTVTFMNGMTSMGTTSILNGKIVAIPSTVVYPFGYVAAGWYKDANLTAVWNLKTDVVTADITLYAKLNVTPSATFMNTGNTNWAIPAVNITNNADGSLKVSGFNGWGSGDAWVVQVNFAPVPATDAAKNYTLAFRYKINGSGADAQVFDKATIGTAVALKETASWADGSISWTGHACTGDSKLTFELGKIPASVSLDFELTNISLTVA